MSVLLWVRAKSAFTTAFSPLRARAFGLHGVLPHRQCHLSASMSNADCQATPVTHQSTFYPRLAPICLADALLSVSRQHGPAGIPRCAFPALAWLPSIWARTCESFGSKHTALIVARESKSVKRQVPQKPPTCRTSVRWSIFTHWLLRLSIRNRPKIFEIRPSPAGNGGAGPQITRGRYRPTRRCCRPRFQ